MRTAANSPTVNAIFVFCFLKVTVIKTFASIKVQSVELSGCLDDGLDCEVFRPPSKLNSFDEFDGENTIKTHVRLTVFVFWPVHYLKLYKPYKPHSLKWKHIKQRFFYVLVN